MAFDGGPITSTLPPVARLRTGRVMVFGGLMK